MMLDPARPSAIPDEVATPPALPSGGMSAAWGVPLPGMSRDASCRDLRRQRVERRGHRVLRVGHLVVP